MSTAEALNELLVWFSVGDELDKDTFDQSFHSTIVEAENKGFLERIDSSRFKVIKRPTTCNC